MSDTDDARVEVVRPEVTVTKTLLSAEPVRPTEEVHFRITIENTGDIWIHDLPLVDEYDKEYLTYGYQSQYATPADSNNHIDDGSIEWADLTGPTPYGFGTDLEPGHSFTVDVYFTAVKDTTQLPGPPAGKTVNTAIVDGALADPDGPGGSAPPPAIPVPRDEDDAAVEIFQPTGLGLVSFDAADQDGGVLLTWETANELDLVGFKLLRRHGKSDYSEITNVIPAEYAGSGSGGVYQYVDTSLTPGYYTYALLAVRYDGSMRLLATDSIMMRWHEPFLDPGDPSLPDVPPTNKRNATGILDSGYCPMQLALAHYPLSNTHTQYPPEAALETHQTDWRYPQHLPLSLVSLAADFWGDGGGDKCLDWRSEKCCSDQRSGSTSQLDPAYARLQG